MTFGALSLDGSQWVLADVAPHVMIKVKRWFPRVDVAAAKLRLKATPENSAELAWFCERYPMRVSPANARELAQRTEDHHARAARVRGLFDGLPSAPRPMAKPPREYQILAAELCQVTGALLCADEVGLGKTVTAIAFLVAEGNLPAAVVVPLNVLEQWARKFAEFAPQVRVHVVRSSVDGESKKRRKERASADVVLVPYSRLSGWANELEPRAVVFDEAHELRHDGTGKYTAANLLRSKAARCMGLSATPIFNYGGEFFNVLGIICPGALGERVEFVREWCTDGDGRHLRVRNPVAFGAWLREQGLMLGRKRKEVGRELPPLVRSIIDVPIIEADSGTGPEMEALAWRAINGTSRERFTSRGEFDHRLREWTGVGKARAVAEFVDELLETSGEAVLLAGWHHRVYDLWRTLLAKWQPVFYTGLEDAKAKDENAQLVISGQRKLIIMSLRAGQGLDGLQDVCKRVVYGELDWSPSVHQQFTGRVYRDGQADPTMEYWLVADEGSDPVILDTLGVKRWQSDGVIDPAGQRASEIQVDPDAHARLAREYLRRRGHDVPA